MGAWRKGDAESDRLAGRYLEKLAHRTILMCQRASEAAGNDTGGHGSSRGRMRGADMGMGKDPGLIEKTDLVVDEIFVKIVMPKLRVVARPGIVHEAGLNAGHAWLTKAGFFPELDDVAAGRFVQRRP